MSPWRSTRISIAEPGFLSLLFAAGVAAWAGATPLAEAMPGPNSRPTTRPLAAAGDSGLSPTSVGPASPQEAELLWRDGRADYGEGRYKEAAYKLERFIARYPGHPGYTEAGWLLARAYLRLDRPLKAKPLLKGFISARGRSQPGIEARVDLAKAQLALQQKSEALLTSDEVLRLASEGDTETRGQALLIKARALNALGREAAAVAAADSAQRLLSEKPSAGLLRETLLTRLELKLGTCAKFPSRGRLDEAQIRDQMDRRGTCLMESVLVFRNAAQVGDSASNTRAIGQVRDAFEAYLNACAHPPGPPPLKPKDRTIRQKESYLHELAAVLHEDAVKKTREATEILRAGSLPSPAPSGLPTESARAISEATAELDRLSSPGK